VRLNEQKPNREAVRKDVGLYCLDEVLVVVVTYISSGGIAVTWTGIGSIGTPQD